MKDNTYGFNIMEINVYQNMTDAKINPKYYVESRFDFNQFKIDDLWFLAIIDTSNGAVNTQIEWGSEYWLEYDTGQDIRRNVALVSFLTAFVAALGGVIAVQLLYNQLVVKYCQKDEGAGKKEFAYDQEAAVNVENAGEMEDNQEEVLLEEGE